uniref:Putative secreted peptide n=1 Tax=Anopheles braziliensis TaxID=58242 RepID=A0A2M3ZEJ4_9DIPT
MIRPICVGWHLVLILFLLQAVCLAAVVALQQLELPEPQRPPDYQRYLRTRRPTLLGEKHVEEVLEVFRTEARPPAYHLNHSDVNHFLALERLHEQQRRSTNPRTTTKTSTTPTTTTTPASDIGTVTSTYRTPTYENRNPEYRFLYLPLITATEIGRTNITIKEADA